MDVINAEQVNASTSPNFMKLNLSTSVSRLASLRKQAHALSWPLSVSQQIYGLLEASHAWCVSSQAHDSGNILCHAILPSLERP